MRLRYVILHHTGFGEPHYDLMFETEAGSELKTFRLPHWPIRQATAIESLKDHRRAYLEYEGPISGNRGEVRRVATGTMQIESFARGWTLVELSLRLEREGKNWVASPAT